MPSFSLASPPAPLPRLALRSREAAEALGISERSLHDLVVSGEIRTFKLGRGPRAARLFPVPELKDWLSRRLSRGAEDA